MVTRGALHVDVKMCSTRQEISKKERRVRCGLGFRSAVTQNADIYGWSFTWIKNSVAVVIELNCPGHLSGPGKSEVEDNHHLRWKFENVIRATQGD